MDLPAVERVSDTKFRLTDPFGFGLAGLVVAGFIYVREGKAVRLTSDGIWEPVPDEEKEVIQEAQASRVRMAEWYRDHVAAYAQQQVLEKAELDRWSGEFSAALRLQVQQICGQRGDEVQDTATRYAGTAFHQGPAAAAETLDEGILGDLSDLDRVVLDVRLRYPRPVQGVSPVGEYPPERRGQEPVLGRRGPAPELDS